MSTVTDVRELANRRKEVANDIKRETKKIQKDIVDWANNFSREIANHFDQEVRDIFLYTDFNYII